MSRIYEDRHIEAHTKSVWVSDACDICGKTRDDIEGLDRSQVDWFTGDYNCYVADPETAQVEGHSGQDVAVDKQFDICGPCFRAKMLPFMSIAGGMGEA